MTDLITFLDKNRKSAVYTGGDINEIYLYLDMIGSPSSLTTSGKSSHHFSPSYSINNDIEYLQTVNAALRTRQNSICECCVIIGNRYDSCIIRGPKLIPPSLRRKMNQINDLHGDEQNEPQI